MSLLITNIKELLQVREISISKVSGNEMKLLPTLKNAYLLIEDDIIVDYGSMHDSDGITAETIIDATGNFTSLIQGQVGLLFYLFD